MTVAEKLIRAKSDIDAVYEAGKASGGDNEFATFKNMDSINYFFASNFNSYYLDKLSELDLSNIKRAQYVFQDNTTLTEFKSVSMPSVALIHGMFQRCTSVKKIDMNGIAATGVITDLFNGCTSLESVTNLDASISTYINRTFDGCTALKTLSFKGSIIRGLDLSSCTLLTHESLMNVIDALAVTNTTYVLTLGETNLAKLTDTEKAAATQKGWTLA